MLDKMTIKLAKLRGIPIYIHWSLTMFLLLSFMNGIDRVLFMLMVFASVLLHEFGHSFMAQYYKITVPKIVLYPFGGIAYIPNSFDNTKEFFITLAGPMVNVVLALVAWQCGWKEFLLINICLMVFNLFPAYPMDGGRLFKCILTFMGFKKKNVTNITFWTMKIVGVFFLVLAIFLKAFMFGFIAVVLLVLPKKSIGNC